MDKIIGIIVLLVFGPAIIGVMTQGFAGILTSLFWFLLFIAACGAFVWAVLQFKKISSEQVKQREAEERTKQKLADEAQARKELRAQTRKLLRAATPKFEDEHSWGTKLGERLLELCGDHMPGEEEIKSRVLTAMSGFYLREIEKFPTPVLPEFANETEEQAFIKSLDPFVERAQRFDHAALREPIAQMFAAYWTQLPRGNLPFGIPLSQTPIANKIVANMCDPFWDDELARRNLLSEMRTKQREGAEAVQERDKTDAPVWPRQYKGKDAHKLYLPREFWPLFDVEVSFSFSDTDRFTHHWCLGHNGTGKTTYLRHFIEEDLVRALGGECSLVVMDSKKLIREMRTMGAFAPHQPLGERVILIDADEPFPLNPFCLPPEQARSVILYMLGNLSNASELQSGALSYLIDAALVCEKPTLRTVRDFFALDIRKGEMPPQFDDFDPDTQFWFKNTFAKLHPSTREGMQQRLTNFLKENRVLDRMLSADSFGLDMSLLGRGGRVLLVDTNRARFGKEGTNVFGRLIIALIDQLSSQRSEMEEGKLKPVFVYIDEAQDYIQSDALFTDILEKARASKIAVTVAHHHTGQIDPRIEHSLSNAGIKSKCEDIGRVSAKTRRASFDLPVSRLDFSDPVWTMSQQDYKSFRELLRSRYPYRTVEPAAKAAGVDDDVQELTQKFDV